MDARGRRLEANFVARVPDSTAQVGVFSIEKESLVEATDPFQYLATYQNAGAGHPVRRACHLVGRRVANDVVRPGRFGEESMEQQRLGERGTKPWEASLGEIQRAPGIEDLRAHGSGILNFLEHPLQAQKRFGIDGCVRIQE